MSKPVSVKISFTLAVDLEAWAREYGTEPTATAVRQDVRAYIEHGAYDQLRMLGLLAEEATP